MHITEEYNKDLSFILSRAFSLQVRAFKIYVGPLAFSTELEKRKLNIFLSKWLNRSSL